MLPSALFRPLWAALRALCEIIRFPVFLLCLLALDPRLSPLVSAQGTPLSGIATGTPARDSKLVGHTAAGVPKQFTIASLLDTYNVKFYGATGNGSTDDTAAIAATFAAAPAGATILFPPGVYLVTATHTLSAANITVSGYGATLKATTSSVRPLAITATGVSLQGLTLDGSHNGTGTPPGSWEGLLAITGSTSTAVDRVTIQDCRFINSNSIGVCVRGNVTGLTLTGNTYAANFIHLFAEPASGYTYKNLTSRSNNYGSNWYTSTYSGSVKLKGDGGSSLYPTGNLITGERILSSGEMGIELWDNIKDSTISDCIVDGPAYAISLDLAENITISNCKTFRNSYCGIELADACHDILVQGNTVDQYSTGTTRGGSKGLVSSGPTNYRNKIIGNTIRGVAGPCIDLQENNNISVRGNRLYDSTILLGFKNSSYMVADGNEFVGPCNYHVFIDANDWNITDTQITGNTFTGTAAFDNIIIYSGVSGRVVTNATIADNDCYAADFTNASINISGTNLTTPNRQVYGNRYRLGAGTTEFTDIATTSELVLPYRAPIQRAGLSVAAKRTLALASSGAARWVKLVDGNFGNPFYLQLHVVGATDAGSPVKNATTVIISAAPYGFDAAITLLPSGNYFGTVIDEIIYNNPSSGAAQEVWIKIPALADPLTLDLYFSDYAERVVVTPTATATEPTWSANSYRARIEAGQSTALQAKGLYARNEILSAATGGIATEADRGGRLHIRGVGTTSYNSTQRIARFDLTNGTEVLGVDSAGVTRVAGKLSVAGADIAAIKSVEATSIDFGTINAGATFAYDLYIGGVTTTNTPAGFFSFEGTFPDGLVVEPLRCTATDYVRLVVRNPTAGNIAVGTKKVRAVVLQF